MSQQEGSDQIGVSPEEPTILNPEERGVGGSGEEPALTPATTDAPSEDRGDGSQSEAKANDLISKYPILGSGVFSEEDLSKLSDALAKGGDLSDEEQALIAQAEKRLVPVSSYTKQRQRDAEGNRKAQEALQQSHGSTEEIRKKAEQLDQLQPFLELLKTREDLVQQIEAAASETGQKVNLVKNPEVEALQNRLSQMEQRIMLTDQIEGQKQVEGFLSSHDDLQENPALRQEWANYAQILASGGDTNPMDHAYELAKSTLDKATKAALSPQEQRVKDFTKKAVAAPQKSSSPMKPSSDIPPELEGILRADRIANGQV